MDLFCRTDPPCARPPLPSPPRWFPALRASLPARKTCPCPKSIANERFALRSRAVGLITTSRQFAVQPPFCRENETSVKLSSRTTAERGLQSAATFESPSRTDSLPPGIEPLLRTKAVRMQSNRKPIEAVVREMVSERGVHAASLPLLSGAPL